MTARGFVVNGSLTTTVAECRYAGQCVTIVTSRRIAVL